MLGFSAIGELPLAGLMSFSTFDQTIAETLTFSDTATATKARDEELSDTVDFVEILARAFVEVLTDTINLTDGVNTVSQDQLIETTLTFTEEYINNLSFTQTLTDTLSFTERLARAFDEGLSDEVSLLDTLGSSKIAGNSNEEFLNIVEAYAVAVDPAHAISDTFVIVESITYLLFPCQQLSDTIAFTEDMACTNNAAMHQADTLSFAEATVVTNFAQQNMSDALSFTDSFVGGLAGTTRGLTDMISIVETLDLFNFECQTPEDFIDFTETFTLTSIRNFGFCDCVTFNDRLSRVTLLTLTDTITFVETTSRFGLGDTIVFVEAFSTNIATGQCCDEQYIPDREIVEALSLAETYVLGKSLRKTVAETLVLQDTIMYL